MNLNIQFIILTYKRPKIASLCLQTLFNNTQIKPNLTWIIDDGSDKQMQNNLLSFSQNNNFNTNLLIKNKNHGVAYSFEDAYSIMRTQNPDIAVIVESDYIWRNGWLEDCLSLFFANPYVVAVPGTSHPDMYDKYKTFTEFPKLMIDQFGKDVKAREYMYSPFDVKCDDFNIKVQGVSNSCGCNVIFWKRFNTILKEINQIDTFWFWMDRAFHKWGNLDRRTASDAHLSGTITYLWEEWAIKNNIDLAKNFAWLDICDYSIGQHVCGGIDSINGKIVPEGQTFINSPSWPNDWQTFKRKKI